MDISYYIDTIKPGSTAEINSVFETIITSFRLHTFPVKLINVKKNITDDILHILCDFNGLYQIRNDSPLIETITGGNYGTKKDRGQAQ